MANSDQPDLFAAGGFPAEQRLPAALDRAPIHAAGLGDRDLIAALPEAGVADILLVVGEIGRRRLVEAIPALATLCRNFAGYGLKEPVPEQCAALEALAEIGGPQAAACVATLLDRGYVQGPGLKMALGAADRLGAKLSAHAVVPLLRHDDPEMRSLACRCVRRGWLDAVPVLVELQGDLHATVRHAATIALGRMGRTEARAPLLQLLRDGPSAEVIEAMILVADDECAVQLGKTARAMPGLIEAVRDALEAIGSPQAEKVAAGLGDFT